MDIKRVDALQEVELWIKRKAKSYSIVSFIVVLAATFIYVAILILYYRSLCLSNAVEKDYCIWMTVFGCSILIHFVLVYQYSREMVGSELVWIDKRIKTLNILSMDKKSLVAGGPTDYVLAKYINNMKSIVCIILDAVIAVAVMISVIKIVQCKYVRGMKEYYMGALLCAGAIFIYSFVLLLIYKERKEFGNIRDVVMSLSAL